MEASRLLQYVVRVVIFWLVLSAQLLGGTIDPDTPDAKYVEFGAKFPFIVLLRGEARTIPENVVVPEGKRLIQWGSAVIIRPHWIITAAHVVEDADNHHVMLGDHAVPLQTVILHPQFEERRMGYYDLALGRTDVDFNLPFYCPLYTEQDELNQPVTIAGYGVTGTFATGAKDVDNKRRAGQSLVTALEHNVLICRPKRGHKFPLEFLIAPGDSGGGLFIGDRLAGINSFLLASDGKPDGTYTDEGAHTRISLYADWIEKEIAKIDAAK